MNELQLIKSAKFGEIEADIYKNGDEPCMTATQLGECLGYSQGRKSITNLINKFEYLKNKEFSSVTKMMTVDNKERDVRVFTEDGIYEITLLSKTEKAKEFRAWVRDILKTVRRHGMYATEELLENPDIAIAAFQALKTEREQRKLLQFECNKQKQIIGELKPKADYTDLVLNSKSLVSITQIAKDYGMSGSKMNSLLNRYGVQFKQSGQWLLYSKYHNNGFTHSETVNITHNDGRADTVMNTKWTQKGRLFIYNLLKSYGILPMIEQNLSA